MSMGGSEEIIFIKNLLPRGGAVNTKGEVVWKVTDKEYIEMKKWVDRIFNGGTRSFENVLEREYATVNLLVGECRGFALEDIYHQYIVTEIPLQYIARLSMNSQKNYTRINEMMNGIHDGVVIIPDLETHVHSSRLEELCRMIYDAAKSRSNKVFASTDSYECIRYMFEVCQNDMWLFRVESENIIEYDPETIEAAIRANLEVR